MNYTKLKIFDFDELKKIAEEMGIKVRCNKDHMIHDILAEMHEYERYKKDKIDKYVRKVQLGEKGKEGTTYLVENANKDEYAMKTFRKQKSSHMLRKEANLQQIAANKGISPNIIEIDTVSKYIVMEKMDGHLFDIMKKQNGNLKQSYQKQIVKIFKMLDEAKVFHGDSNILNYMFKGSKIYIIDFGMAKKIDTMLIKKLGTKTPNINIMTLGLTLKLKELGCPPSSYSLFLKYLTEGQIKNFNLS
jgi:tRNA A-37 threonylcarbamoyl transferase component Bud32